MDIGTVVQLKKAYAGNKPGIRGVCYATSARDTYIIFENGNYEDFPREEQERCLREIEVAQDLCAYRFVSVSFLLDDFRKGRFDSVFKRKNTSKKMYNM